MADKILMEAFDKLKAIEESDDPFCIGELSENEEDIAETYTEVKEDDYDDPMAGRSDEYTKRGEEPNAKDDLEWSQPTHYEMGTDSGDHYEVEFQNAGGGEERAFIVANGITIATYKVGGAGAMNAVIKDPEAVLDMLTEALKTANGQGM